MGCGSGTRQRERIVNTSGKETKAETRAGQVGVTVSSLCVVHVTFIEMYVLGPEGL